MKIKLHSIKRLRFSLYKKQTKQQRLIKMDISEVCNLCNKPNDQMLMLKCVHDPCINCASTTYAQQIHIKGQSHQVYVCEICGQQTHLDTTTVQQLTKLASHYVKSPTKAYPIRKSENQTLPTAKKYEASTSVPTQPNMKKVSYYCKDHPEQQVTYYCFSCWENICPQCAIHGSHKDHTVKMIKKAIVEVKNVYNEKIGKLSAYQNSVVKGKDNFLRIIKSTNERHTRQKHIISKQFQAIRTALTIQQKQLMKQLDDINKHNIETLTTILQQVNSNYEQSNKLKKSVELILKKDQVLVLQEYKKINQIESSIDELNSATERIGGKINSLNGEYLIEEVREVAEVIKKIRLKLEEEKIGINQYIDQGQKTHFRSQYLNLKR